MYSAITNDFRTIEFLKDRSVLEYYVLMRSFILYLDLSLYNNMEEKEGNRMLDEIDKISYSN